MAWFNRSNKSTVVLPELEKYYDAERRERSGLAWILALVSVAGVALVLIGVLFGGRWIYRQTRGYKPNVVAVVQEESSTVDSEASTDKTAPVAPPATTPAPAPDTKVVTPPAPSTPAATPTPASSSTKVLANTGPEEIIPAFMTATATGILAYRRKLAKKA